MSEQPALFSEPPPPPPPEGLAITLYMTPADAIKYAEKLIAANVVFGRLGQPQTVRFLSPSKEHGFVAVNIELCRSAPGGEEIAVSRPPAASPA